ncbi:hypothetical protein [Tenacibaculum ovolyticum]|uniref:hypothetical protein n=1 Tax=Tenacibaculum ovolyticum TaxID=104270 RepID=UPI001F1FD26C|nr:hypothetical protein [Tenacibaculum ovolyticum]
MKKIILIICFTVCRICFSQHTDSYLDFTNDYIFLDSSNVNIKWKNGKIRELKNIMKISYKNKQYEYFTGVFLQFNKKGKKRTESLFDKYGNYLSYKFYDLNGIVSLKKTTEKIDYNKKTALVEIIIHEKHFMKTKEENYLYKEGKKLNDKKIGKWLTYNFCGNIIKEKKHSK